MWRCIILRLCKAAVDFSRFLIPLCHWFYRIGLFMLGAALLFIIFVILF